jgi:hypothetical protein
LAIRSDRSDAKRSTAFGIFDGIFGLTWLLGNIPVGILYTISLPAVVIFSMVFQFSALPVLYLANQYKNKA